MGNCTVKAVADGKTPDFVKVLTDSEKVFEFKCPKLAGHILREYPAYTIYGRNYGYGPLSREETLVGGQVYYLLPQGTNPKTIGKSPTLGLKLQVPTMRRNGFWKVKMVIEAKYLEEILAEDGNIEALIERLRIAVAATVAANASTKTLAAATHQSSGLRTVGCKYAIPMKRCI